VGDGAALLALFLVGYFVDLTMRAVLGFTADPTVPDSFDGWKRAD